MNSIYSTLAAMVAVHGGVLVETSPTGRIVNANPVSDFGVDGKSYLDMETTLANVDYAEVEHRIINQMDRRQSEIVAEMLGPNPHNYFDNFFGAPPIITDPDHWNPVFRETRQLQATVGDLISKSHRPKKNKRAKRRT